MSETITELAASLNAAAKLHTAAADHSYTIDDETTRLRNAAQLRFVGALVTSGPGMIPLGQAWVTASGTLLATYNEVDQARVHMIAVAEGYGAEFNRVTDAVLDTMSEAAGDYHGLFN
jgi:hypothetical protein